MTRILYRNIRGPSYLSLVPQWISKVVPDDVDNVAGAGKNVPAVPSSSLAGR
jgi:hypothetical protein